MLDIDTGAEKVSFTSGRNPEPNSLQIILRTKEIELEDEETIEVDLEQESAAKPTSVWYRIQQIFVKIWNSIISIFKKK